MTCFWDSILKTLNNRDFLLFKTPKMQNQRFVEFLKHFNIRTHEIRWNGELLTKKQLDENFEHIKEFDPNTIRNGYDCSIFDPFLFLVCKLFKVSIEHDYLGNIMKYQHPDPNKILHFASNRGHFRNVTVTFLKK